MRLVRTVLSAGMSQEEDIINKEWIGGQDLYRDPEYIKGSHPMDTDEVTWHHVWEKPSPQVEGEG